MLVPGRGVGADGCLAVNGALLLQGPVRPSLPPRRPVGTFRFFLAPLPPAVHGGSRGRSGCHLCYGPCGQCGPGSRGRETMGRLGTR